MLASFDLIFGVFVSVWVVRFCWLYFVTAGSIDDAFPVNCGLYLYCAGHVHRQNCLKEFGANTALQKLEIKFEHKRLQLQ